MSLKKMINTYNETSLHKTLKNIYALENDGSTEQKFASYICDIITNKGDVIEIQTSNISALTQKAEFILKNDKKLTIIHPIIQKKLITTYSEDGTLLLKRKSPKESTIYSMLRGLTGIYKLLTHKNFILEVLFIDLEEIRVKTKEKIQSKNKSRHHLKDYLIQDKKLISINSKLRFRTKEDYKKLLVLEEYDDFTVPKVKKAIFQKFTSQKMTKANAQSAAKNAGLLVWILEKMGIIRQKGFQGRSRLYSLEEKN